MSSTFLVAAEDRSLDAAGLDKMVDLSTDDPSAWGGLVFSNSRKAFIKAEFDKAAPAGRLDIKKVRVHSRVRTERVANSTAFATRALQTRPPHLSRVCFYCSCAQTWSLIFVDTERLEYDFDTFDQDLQATCEGCKEDMSWADVQKFFDENL